MAHPAVDTIAIVAEQERIAPAGLDEVPLQEAAAAFMRSIPPTRGVNDGR